MHRQNMIMRRLFHFKFLRLSFIDLGILIFCFSDQGLVLFAVHGMTGPGLSIKCRMRGPCNVNAITVNNSVMDPLMPSKEVAF